MKYFIFSDIHGNLEALQAVMVELDRESEYSECTPICLGDIVGYGPNPRECIAEIRRRNIRAIAGNHDYAATGRMDISYFNPYAKDAVLWTKNILTPDDMDFLMKLELQLIFDEMTFVHATPCDSENWNYLFTLYDAQHNFECFGSQACFVGHSHYPAFIIQKETHDCWVHPHPVLSFRDGWKYIINVGSVGQPRDGNPQSSFAVYDRDTQTIELRRAKYDISLTQQKMRDARLPEYLIERLEMGR